MKNKKYDCYLLVGGISAICLAMGISRFGFTPIIPLMQRDLSIDEWAIAVLASVNYLGYFGGAYVSSTNWVEQHLRTWLSGGSVASIFFLMAMSITSNELLWSCFRLASGFFSAVLFVVASSIVLGKGRNDLAGQLYSGVGIGIAFTGLFVPWLDRLGGWQASWQGLALGGGIFGAIAWSFLSKELKVSIHKEPVQVKVKFERNYVWYILLLSYGLEGIGYIITATYIVQMIGTMPELSYLANQSWILIGLAAVPSTYMWGVLSQKISALNTLVRAFALQAVGILFPVILSTQAGILLGSILFGGTFMGITSLTIALANRLYPEHRMQAIGELTTVYALGQIIGPIVAAYLQRMFSTLAPSFFAVGVLILALLALIVFAMNGSKIKIRMNSKGIFHKEEL